MYNKSVLEFSASLTNFLQSILDTSSQNINPLNAEYIAMRRPFLIFSQLDHLIQVVSTQVVNFHILTVQVHG